MPKWSQIEKGQTCQIEANCSQTGAKLKTVRWGTPPGPMGCPPLGRLIVLTTLSGRLQEIFWEPCFRILSRFAPQNGPILEAKTDPTSIKSRYKKGSNFEGLLEGHTFGKSLILEAKMEPSWHQNGVKDRVLCKYGKSYLELAG